MIYFTSDMHLGHRAVITMQNRPFADVEEMNRAIITNYNAVVHKDDTVYILGDIAHRIRVEEVNELISKLNGKKYLLRGNHDKVYAPALFEEIRDFMTIVYKGQSISLMHYPMLSWPKSHYGSIMLHGHMHNDESYNLENRKNGILRYDVGVEANGYYPVSVEQIMEFFGIKL